MRASCWARRFPLSAPVYYLLPTTRVSISALRVPLCALPDICGAVRSLRKFSHRFPLPLDASPTSRCLCSPFSAAISTLRSTICLRLSAARCCLFLCVFFHLPLRVPLSAVLPAPRSVRPLAASCYPLGCLLSAVRCDFSAPPSAPRSPVGEVRGRSPYTACSGCAAVCSASATHSRWPLVVAALRAIAQQGTPSGPGGARGDAPAQPRRHLAAIGAWIMQQAARPGSRCCRRAATSASQVTCGRVNMYTQVTRVDASVRPAGRGVCVLRCSFPPILFGPAVPRATRSVRSACPPARRVALLPPRGRQGAVQSATRATR